MRGLVFVGVFGGRILVVMRCVRVKFLNTCV